MHACIRLPLFLLWANLLILGYKANFTQNVKWIWNFTENWRKFYSILWITVGALYFTQVFESKYSGIFCSVFKLRKLYSLQKDQNDGFGLPSKPGPSSSIRKYPTKSTSEASILFDFCLHHYFRLIIDHEVRKFQLPKSNFSNARAYIIGKEK
jgi:hypothetical protein